MALGTVAGSTIVSQVWKNVYEVISTHVTDPLSRSRWVWSAFPIERKGTEALFPCIVIESPSIGSDQFVIGSTKMYEWSVPVSVYHTKMATCDTVADDIMNQLEANSGTFTDRGLNQPSITAAPTTHGVVNNQPIHEKRIEVSFEGAL